jgi:hypothetical protein
LPSSEKVMLRMDLRVADLSANLEHFVGVFDEAERFSGPSLYFHLKTLGCLRNRGSATQAILSEDLFDWLYATLASWGMHRMGRGNTKLRDLDVIKASVRAQGASIASLQDLSLIELSPAAVTRVSHDLWILLSSLTISIAEAQIVANSKVLHHLLPKLVPPIDRTYTFHFFYNRNMLTITEEEAFKEMFLRFHEIAIANRDLIKRLVGQGWNTSETKVIDNAIVGYVIEVLRVSES